MCYSRHPWDVRVKVGSERKFASSDKFAKSRQISPKFGVGEIGRTTSWNFSAGDPQIPFADRGIWREKAPYLYATSGLRTRIFGQEIIRNGARMWRQYRPKYRFCSRNSSPDVPEPPKLPEIQFLVKKSFATVRACGALIGPNIASAPTSLKGPRPARYDTSFWSCQLQQERAPGG